ncbi:MAG: large subunit ribosomal protein [Solirubrobacterales bacterium]|jgi:large subunit ribosomal protein L10|nr:large subunit ribosomal protein [Solirubrobacterales bacterium]
MDRTQKEAAVAELTEGLKGAEAIFAVDYRGISVTEAAELRGKLREADAVFKVVKNRLAKRAAADAGTNEIDELLVGPTALTLIHGDAVIAAKAIADFAKAHNVLAYKGGIMDGEALDPDGFAVIARLPGLEVLRGQLVGVAASPITGLVRGLGSMVSGLAIALGQIAEQGLVSGEPPVAEEPEAAEEPAAEEEPAEADEPAAEDEGDEPAPPAEHAEQEAQPEEPEDAPADEPPAETETETSDDDEQEQEEPSGDESDN